MDEDFSLDVLYIDQDIYDELFQMILIGSSSQLDTRLNQLDNPRQYLTLLRRYHQQQISLLMLAASNGYYDIVRLLLSHDCTPNQVELKGTIIVSDQLTINGATALYCACYHGHFKVARTLIELGRANVNQDTNDDPFYPLLLHATIRNRRDIVAFLLDHKYADVNETKSFDADRCTALIWAAFRGYTSLIEYLIANGADINYSCQNLSLTSSTPFGCAVLAGHLDAVRLLYRAGVNTDIRDKDGNTPLEIAVRRKYPMIIDFLLIECINTIEDLELIACSLSESYSSMREPTPILTILKMPIEQRLRLDLPKVPLKAIAVYDYQQECQTVDELDSIKDDPHRIFIETLLIRERIVVSRNDMSIAKPINSYVDALVQRRQFEKGLNLLIHMFYLYQRMNISTTLHRFLWLLCHMMVENEPIPVEWFLKVGRLVFEPSHLQENTVTAHNSLFLIIIATKVGSLFFY